MRTLVVLLAAALPAAHASDAPGAWTPELTMEVRTIGSVTPSPDGAWVAWTETRAVIEADKSEQLTHIFLGRADGSRRFQLTQGEKSCTAPAFSPDSAWVYFQSERTGKPNLFRIRVDGGEAERITDWKGSIGSFRVSPDGKWVAFTGRKDSEEEEKARKEKRDFQVVDEKPKNHSLWLLPASGEIKPPRELTGGEFHVQDFDWAPDGRFIALVRVPTPVADDWTRSDILELALESGAVRLVAASPAAERSPRYSPDGAWLAFLRSSEPPRWAGEDRIVLLRRADGTTRTLGATYDEQPEILGWSRDGRRIYFMETRRTRTTLFALPLEGAPAAVHEPPAGTLGAANLNRAGDRVGFAWETSEEAPEAWVMALTGGQPIRVSRANADLPRPPLGKTEIVRWRSPDGLEIEGLLTYPVGYQAGKRVPLILLIHGGPAGVFRETFLGTPGLYPLAAFSARGYAVLRPNPRGSSGYGKPFRFANYNDWGGRDYEDLMAGVDHVIRMGVADPERLAVMGWSYGGYMTSWIITQTRRFQAAIIGAPVTNLWSFTGTSDIPGFLPDYFSGEPWENFEAYRKHSPLAHAKGVTTPALILHGEADVRVPISQAYEFYQALKRQGAPVKMVVYPREGHGPREPKFRLDIMNRHLEWLEKYVR